MEVKYHKMKKFRKRQVIALGEKYSLTAFEYIEIDHDTRTGVIRNSFSNGSNKYNQRGKEVETLVFTREEMAKQFPR